MRIIILVIFGLITAFLFLSMGSILFWQMEIGPFIAIFLGLVAGSLFTYYYARESRISKVLLRASLVCLAATIALPILALPGSLYQHWKTIWQTFALMFGSVFAIVAIAAYIRARH